MIRSVAMVAVLWPCFLRVVEQAAWPAEGPPSERSAPVDGGVSNATKQMEASSAEPVEWIEIIYRGKPHRVAVQRGRSMPLKLDDSQWTLSLSRASEIGEAAAPGDASGGGVSPPVPETFWGRVRSWFNWSTGTIINVALMVSVLLAVLGYFLVYEPIRRRRPLRAALQIIQDDQRSRFNEAEELLDRSLLAGLRRKDIAQARFAMALLRSLMGKHEEAATVLGDLIKSGLPVDRPIAYLMLWLQCRLKNHERVERIYVEHQKLLAGFQQSDLIASISYLALARLRWARREINGAMHYFDEVRKLQVLADEIPSHIDDHEAVLGTVALFEKNNDEAVKHFNAAVVAAQQRGKPTHPGKLGLLLCDWRQSDGASVNEKLDDVLSEMQQTAEATQARFTSKCPNCGKVYLVQNSMRGKKGQCRACHRRFTIEIEEQAAEESTEPKSEEESDRLLSEDEQLMRNVRLWHCMALLAVWLAKEERSNLAATERKTLEQRLQLVSDMDPDMGDPYLIGGLIEYYFAADDLQRKAACEQIEKAVARDVHVPEVLQLIEREKKLAALSDHSLTYFHQLSGQYAESADVPLDLRRRFAQMMNRHNRFRELGAIEASAQQPIVSPSLENLRGRGEILQTRVTNIVRYRLGDTDPEARDEIDKHLKDLNERSRSLSEMATAFQQSEFGLMESTGEFLFEDEEPLDGKTEIAAGDKQSKE